MSIETYQGANGVATYQPQNVPAVRPRTVQRLTEWAESAQAAHQVAESLVQTSFVPEAFRGKAHEATAAILAGDEVGLSPMASLRSFDIIQGTAAPRALTLRAIVQSQGHEVWVVESTSTRCIVAGRRAGTGREQHAEWTIDRAKQLKLTGKPNWQNQPQAMLLARATSELCRMIASDAILGVPYAVEELADGVVADWQPTEPQQQITASQPARRTAQRRIQPRSTQPAESPAPAETTESTEPDEPTGPALPGEDDYSELTDEQTPTVDTITDAQSKKLHALFREGGITNRDTKLQASSLIVGRELETSKDLTKTEASKLIDTLEEFAQDPVGLAEMLADLLGNQSQDGAS